MATGPFMHKARLSPRRAGGLSALIGILLLAACGTAPQPPVVQRDVPAMTLFPNETPELRQQIDYWANHYQLPSSLVQRLVVRESRHVPWARNGPYWGLLQIRHDTARGMGYSGAPEGLLNPDTNLQYGVKYLRGAYMVADGNPDEAIMWYARGYYYEAKRKGLLDATGLR